MAATLMDEAQSLDTAEKVGGSESSMHGYWGE